MKIKVCGITALEQMQELASMKVDFVGMIFYPGSKRFAGEVLKSFQDDIKELDIKKIGVFVNSTQSEVLDAVRKYGLYAVQLHGDEDAAYCKQLMGETVVIKAFRIDKDSNIDTMAASYTDACHFYLFDTATVGYGGSGKHFDWIILNEAKIDKPFFLSGGISLADADAIKKIRHTFLYSIDINSRFETSPGIKDLTLVQTFLEELN